MNKNALMNQLIKNNLGKISEIYHVMTTDINHYI